MKNLDTEKLKEKILDFAIRGVENFIYQNPSLKFYAFAFDCNAEYAEISLCFNTEGDFEETLKQYQNGSAAQFYKSDEAILALKYNPGDWKYQSFAIFNVLTDDELAEIFDEFPDDDYKSWNEFIENLMRLFRECLIDFTRTQTYNQIPKAENFIAFCIDHEEDFEDAIEKMETLKRHH